MLCAMIEILTRHCGCPVSMVRSWFRRRWSYSVDRNWASSSAERLASSRSG